MTYLRSYFRPYLRTYLGSYLRSCVAAVGPTTKPPFCSPLYTRETYSSTPKLHQRLCPGESRGQRAPCSPSGQEEHAAARLRSWDRRHPPHLTAPGPSVGRPPLPRLSRLPLVTEPVAMERGL